MIQLKINNMDHKAVLTVPADYERVILALWTLGLDRDPEKYTLRQLDAEFTFTTEEESHMVQLIDPRSSLMNALCLLSEMVYGRTLAIVPEVDSFRKLTEQELREEQQLTQQNQGEQQWQTM